LQLDHTYTTAVSNIASEFDQVVGAANLLPTGTGVLPSGRGHQSPSPSINPDNTESTQTTDGSPSMPAKPQSPTPAFDSSGVDSPEISTVTSPILDHTSRFEILATAQ
jgi:hypothetical protein